MTAKTPAGGACTADVWMVRPTLDHLPHWVLPAGYRFRGYRAGDEHTWVALHQNADHLNDVTMAEFVHDYDAHLAALPDRMIFAVTDQDEPVGTATAWWDDDWQHSGPWGQVHWVVVAEAHQGQGIGKALVSRVLKRLAVDHVRAVLGTNTGRPPAIKIYLDAGFVPYPGELVQPSVLTAWMELQRTLQHPALGAALSSVTVQRFES